MIDRRKIRLAVLLAIGILPFELNGFYNPRLVSMPALSWAVQILTWAVMPVAIYLLARRWKLFTPEEIGLSQRIRGRVMPMTLTALCLLAPFVFYHLDRASVRWGLRIWPENPGHVGFTYDQMLPLPGPTTGWLQILALIFLSASAGIVEELYYRGMMRRLFRAGAAGSVAFTLVSSLVFTSVHWEFGLAGMFESLIWGLAAALAYVGLRNLYPLIIAHMIVDYLWLIHF